MTIGCYLFFILWPIQCEKPIFLLKEDYPLKILHDKITFESLYQNAFPSMHVVVSSFLCLAYYHDFKSFRFLSIGIGILIFLSTFLVKQHFFLDSISGLLIGILGFCYYKSKA